MRDGFYWFCPEGTPHYPGVHLLGSGIWTSDERVPEPKLGEYTGERSFYPGHAPARRPLPVLVGSPQCIELGEKEGLPVVNDVGADCAPILPGPCYGPEDLLRAKTNVIDCVFAKKCADIIDLAYTDLDLAELAAQDFLGDDATITTFDRPHPLFPAGVIGVVDNTAVLWLTGTTTLEQGATQALYFGHGPINQGAYSVSGIDQAAAFVVLDILTGVLPVTPTRLVLTGHSYGGAIVDVMAAILLLADPTREVELLTLGAPQPGDERLFKLLENIPQQHYANERDPIPYLPPKGTTFAAFIPIIGPLLTLMWPQFHRPPNTMMILEEGAFAEVSEEQLPIDLMQLAANVIAQARAMPGFKAHKTAWYAYYLCLACKCVPKPCVPPDEQELVFDMELEDFEFVFDGVNQVVNLGPLHLPVVAHFGNGQPRTWGVLIPGVGGFRIDAALQEFELYTTFIASYSPDPVDPVWLCDWTIDAEDMTAGVETTDFPDPFGEKLVGDGVVSPGALKIRPTLA